MERKSIRIVLALLIVGPLTYLGLSFLNARSVLNSFEIRPVKYVYIDMGTNNGDSILSFFGMDKNGYPKFLDQSLINQKEWIVYAFEANARFNEDIKGATHKVLEKQPNVKFNLFTETAVWTRNGHIRFYLDKVNTGSSFWGSSLKEQHVDVINSKKVFVDVVCVDIVDILRQYNKNDFIVVKMDVEGAEYELMAHMIVNNVLNLVDYLGVEYHNRVMEKTPESIITSEDMLNFIMNKSDVKLIKWV